ncbi:MAG: type II secretion system F family protein [Candidatus Hydrogenedentes bacterium]|nr:type II secretion system F family protein [Candidatus Hydrogenedentota bacterium]
MRPKKRRKDLLAVTWHLKGILRQHASIVEALRSAALDAPNRRVESILLALADDLAAGYSMTEAMRRRPRFYPPFYVDLVQAGEKAGRVAEVFPELEVLLQRAGAFRNRLKYYCLYLGAILAVEVTIVAFSFVKLWPVFFDLYAEFGARLPWFARVVSGFMTRIGSGDVLAFAMGLAFLIVTSWYLAKLVRARGNVAGAAGWIGLSIPFLRGIIIRQNLGHVALVLEQLLAARVPLDKALEDAAALDLNPIFASMLQRVRQRVLRGSTLTNALAREINVPTAFRGFVSLGESSGLLPEALGRVAQLYQRQAAKTSRILLDIISPLGVVILACGVFWFHCTLFIMVMTMSDIVNQAGW